MPAATTARRHCAAQNPEVCVFRSASRWDVYTWRSDFDTVTSGSGLCVHRPANGSANVALPVLEGPYCGCYYLNVHVEGAKGDDFARLPRLVTHLTL